MARVITFGELMLRLQPFNYERFVQAQSVEFTFGGGESTDKDMRLESGLWWREEEPTPDELADGAARLDEAGLKVDYIITHEPPSLVKSAILLRRGDSDRVNKLNGYFDKISRECEYRHWFFGSLHEDRIITERHSCVFKKVIPVKLNEKTLTNLEFTLETGVQEPLTLA